MKICTTYEAETNRPERAPTAVPAGIFLMGLLVMTFETVITIMFGVMLALWGATVLVMRAAKIACCMKTRKERRARGEDAPNCLTA